MNAPIRWAAATAAFIAIIGVPSAPAQQTPVLPWMNAELPAEERADMLIAEMTLEQKVQQISNDTRPAEA